MNPVVIRLIYLLLCPNMSFSVRVNGCPSRKLFRTTGLPQGSPVSSILFNRFIDSLLQTLNWQNWAKFPCSFWFADDRVLTAPTFAKAQSLVNQASHWTDQHGMTFLLPSVDIWLHILPLKFCFQYILIFILTNCAFHMCKHTISWCYLFPLRYRLCCSRQYVGTTLLKVKWEQCVGIATYGVQEFGSISWRVSCSQLSNILCHFCLLSFNVTLCHLVGRKLKHSITIVLSKFQEEM